GMVHEALLLMFTSIEKEREFYIKACKLEGQNSFESIVKECIKKVILSVIEEKITGKKPPHEWLTPEHLAEYYSQSMCFVAMNWIKSNMSIPAKEVADIYQYVIKRSLEDILSEM
ncbi:MAG: TetR-like C-terminal domain-containing protein, partial [Lachnospiraceae bacterium]|nr:TetR-like C-terminal domain-containing protein [Lachnospiraceae bacterium]